MLPSPSDDRVGDLSSWFSKLNTLPVAAPVYASDRISRCVPQDSGPGWIRCSFPVGLFHSLLHAGLSRRTACPTLFIGDLAVHAALLLQTHFLAHGLNVLFQLLGFRRLRSQIGLQFGRLLFHLLALFERLRILRRFGQ